MPNALCARCNDKTEKDPWWGRNPEGVKVPVCGNCFCQLRSHLSGMPKVEWGDEPIHKKMERMEMTTDA